MDGLRKAAEELLNELEGTEKPRSAVISEESESAESYIERHVIYETEDAPYTIGTDGTLRRQEIDRRRFDSGFEIY